MKYQKNETSVVDAVKFDGFNVEDVYNMISDKIFRMSLEIMIGNENKVLYVIGKNGSCVVNTGDYIVCNGSDLYTCTDEEFSACYDPVEEF